MSHKAWDKIWALESHLNDNITLRWWFIGYDTKCTGNKGKRQMNWWISNRHSGTRSVEWKVTHKMREKYLQITHLGRTLYRKDSYNSDLKDEKHSLNNWPRIQMDASTRLKDKWPTMRETQNHLSTGRWGVIPHPVPNKVLIMICSARTQQNGKSSGTAGGDKRWHSHFRKAWQLIKRIGVQLSRDSEIRLPREIKACAHFKFVYKCQLLHY